MQIAGDDVTKCGGDRQLGAGGVRFDIVSASLCEKSQRAGIPHHRWGVEVTYMTTLLIKYFCIFLFILSLNFYMPTFSTILL